MLDASPVSNLPQAVGARKRMIPLLKRGPWAWENARRSAEPADALRGTNRLLVHGVQGDSEAGYYKSVKRFLEHVSHHRISFYSLQDKDGALANYLADLCYLHQSHLGEAQKVMSGFLHYCPEFKDRLPLASRALVSWARLAAPLEGGPVTPEAAAVISCDLLKRGRIDEGILVWVAADCFFRLQDLFDMQGGRVVGRGPTAILLGDREAGKSLKTGSGQGVVIDRPWLAFLLREWQRDLRQGEPFWTTEAGRFRKEWHSSASRLEVAWTPPPHGLRHMLPTLQVALGQRTLEEIRRRGRWRGMGSVQRYTKVHRLIRDQERLPDGLRALGQDILGAPVPAMMHALREAPDSPQAAKLLRILERVPPELWRDDSFVKVGSLVNADGVPLDEPPSAHRPRSRRK
jgi:hypothetical protein